MKNSKLITFIAIGIFAVAILCIPIVVVFGGTRAESAATGGGTGTTLNTPVVTRVSRVPGRIFVSWEHHGQVMRYVSLEMRFYDASGNHISGTQDNPVPPTFGARGHLTSRFITDTRVLNAATVTVRARALGYLQAEHSAFGPLTTWDLRERAYHDAVIDIQSAQGGGISVHNIPFGYGIGTPNWHGVMRDAYMIHRFFINPIRSDDFISRLSINGYMINLREVEYRVWHQIPVTNTEYRISTYGNRVSLEVQQRFAIVNIDVLVYVDAPVSLANLTLNVDGDITTQSLAAGWRAIAEITPDELLENPAFRGWALSPNATVPTFPNVPSGGILILGNLRLYAVFI